MYATKYLRKKQKHGKKIKEKYEAKIPDFNILLNQVMSHKDFEILLRIARPYIDLLKLQSNSIQLYLLDKFYENVEVNIQVMSEKELQVPLKITQLYNKLHTHSLGKFTENIVVKNQDTGYKQLEILLIITQLQINNIQLYSVTLRKYNGNNVHTFNIYAYLTDTINIQILAIINFMDNEYFYYVKTLIKVNGSSLFANTEKNNQYLISNSLKSEMLHSNICPANNIRIKPNGVKYYQMHVIKMIKNMINIYSKNCKSKIANHTFFSIWIFRDVALGYYFSVILRQLCSNIFNTTKFNSFVIIKITLHNILVSNVDLSPLQAYISISHYSIFEKQLYLDLPIIIKLKHLKTYYPKANKNVDFDDTDVQRTEKQYTLTNAHFKDFLIEFGTSTEQDIYEHIEAYLQINKVITNLYLKLFNSTLWLPYLCGDSYNNKIGNMAYLLKCSCLNESAVNLDNVEIYVRELAELVTSLEFYKMALKCFGISLANLFIHL